MSAAQVVTLPPAEIVCRDYAGDRARFVERIRAHLTGAAQAIGEILIEAKSTLPHGQFEAMVREDFGWSPSKARRLMAIAAHPVLADRSHVNDLPASWSTLYELAKHETAEIEVAISIGLVTPKTQRKDVAAIFAPRADQSDDRDPDGPNQNWQLPDLVVTEVDDAPVAQRLAERAKKLALEVRAIRRDAKELTGRESRGIDSHARAAIVEINRLADALVRWTAKA